MCFARGDQELVTSITGNEELHIFKVSFFNHPNGGRFGWMQLMPQPWCRGKTTWCNRRQRVGPGSGMVMSLCLQAWTVGWLGCWNVGKTQSGKLWNFRGLLNFGWYARVGHCGTAFVWGFSCLDMYKASFCYGTAICFIVGFAEGRTKFCMWLTCSSTWVASSLLRQIPAFLHLVEFGTLVLGWRWQRRKMHWFHERFLFSMSFLNERATHIQTNSLLGRCWSTSQDHGPWLPFQQWESEGQDIDLDGC